MVTATLFLVDLQLQNLVLKKIPSGLPAQDPRWDDEVGCEPCIQAASLHSIAVEIRGTSLLISFQPPPISRI